MGWVFFGKLEEILRQKFRFPSFWWCRFFQTDLAGWFFRKSIENFGWVKNLGSLGFGILGCSIYNCLFKNCAPFTDCIREINNAEIDHAKDNYVVMAIYNVIEYKDNYSETSGCVWQYYRDEPAINNNITIFGFPDDTDSGSFKFKQKLAGQTGVDGREDVQIMLPLIK